MRADVGGFAGVGFRVGVVGVAVGVEADGGFEVEVWAVCVREVALEEVENLGGVLAGVEEGVSRDAVLFVRREKAGLVPDVEDDAVFFGVAAEILQREGIVRFFVDADGERGVDVVGGDVGHDFLT